MLSKADRILIVLFVLIFFLSAVVDGQEKTVLVATGSSMPEPLYKSWIEACPQHACRFRGFRRRRCADPRSPAPRREESSSRIAGCADRNCSDLPTARYYLAKVSPEFLATAGRGESPKWPVGQAFQRSQDLVAKLRNTPGAIGYTELNLAASAGVRFASIKNAAGEFIKPSTKSIDAAASSSGSKMIHDFRISMTNAPGKESYPISSFSWLYVPAVAKDPARGRALADYLKWVYTSGQKVAQEQGYATLPEDVLEKVAAKAATVR